MIWTSIRFDYKLIELKKPWDIFSPQVERKRSKKYFVITLAIKESFERFSCLEFIFEKRRHRVAGLKHKQRFSETLKYLSSWMKIVVSIYSTSDVMNKKYKRLVYTSPDLLARFCKVNLWQAKNSAWFVFQEFVFLAMLFFGCTYKAINSM